ncbi:hypothetical protein CDN99_22160 [Roseateles aquatilis]|uniref:TonB C-terminal domain-containing protein n=2 Tax=Roseateles aquatilis TaxID=431061 RepID=A0A2D0ALZ1_9BURK|nr:hypothetical protein CDN99_22160 [Roseateles aquatilis]
MAVAMPVALALIGSGAARAQERVDLLPPVPILERTLTEGTCLTRPAEPLYYPSRSWRMEESGLFRFALTFSRPDRAPDVEVLTAAGNQQLLQAAKARVTQHRLPCMASDAPAQQVIEEISFNATPRPESHAVAPSAAPHPARAKALWACLRTPETPPAAQPPDFGTKTATTVLLFKFTAPDAPPTIEVIYNSGSDALLAVFKAYVSSYRMPCLTAEDASPVTQQMFRYAVDDVRQTLADPLPLRALLANVKDIRNMVAKFDFDAMGCPFDVTWTLWRPAMPNDARQVASADAYDARREPFLKWLTTLELNLTPERFEQLLGSTTRIQVPCGSLNLAANE